MATVYAGGKPAARRFRFDVAMAYLELQFFRFVKCFVGIGYIAVITEGVRMVVPALGTKIHQMPMLGALKNYEFWHDLDLAPFVAVLIFLFSSTIWGVLLEAWLYDNGPLGGHGRQPEKYQICMLILGSIILFSDACLFYRAMTLVGWGGEMWSWSSLFSTLAYLAVLVSMCMVAVNLKRKYLSLKHNIAL